ncbi:hypothetical protein Syun_022625 [Stephania yunnanensis]|uniref:Uncharacterized protein n=1 Tax=Stephania yunnanensis TaxID=152371 RepID=A0AAP0FL74_9MAGN
MKFVVVANGVFNDLSALSSLLFLIVTAVALATTTQAEQFGVIDPPYKDPTVPVEDRVSDLLSRMQLLKLEMRKCHPRVSVTHGFSGLGRVPSTPLKRSRSWCWSRWELTETF